MNYAAFIGVADETELARARTVVRDSRPIPKCHPGRPFAGSGLCPECYAAARATESADPVRGEVITPDLRTLADRLEPISRTRGGTWLSPVQGQVVDCLIEGLSNKDIARRLGISHQTVKNHMSSIFRKTGARSRTQVLVLRQRRQAGIDIPAALAYLGEVRMALARVQGDVDRLLRTVREAEERLRSLPEVAS